MRITLGECPLKSAQEHLVQGRGYAEKGRYGKAVDAFTQAIECDPHNTEAYMGRGKVLRELGLDRRAADDYAQCLLALARAIDQNPRDAGAYTKRGQVFYDLNLYRCAIADYTRAAEIAPGPEVYHGRAFAYLAMDRWQAFVDDYMRVIDCRTQAVERQPNCAQSYYERAQAYEMLIRMGYSRSRWGLLRGRRDIQKWAERALPDYDRALELEPDHWEVLVARCAAHRAWGRAEQALADVNRMIELRPDDPSGYATRAEFYGDLGRCQDALADLDRLVELDPDRSWACSFRALIYKRMGRLEEADSYLRQAQQVEARRAERQRAEQPHGEQANEMDVMLDPAHPSLRARHTGLAFFERPADRVPRKPVYRRSFPRQRTRYVAWALSLVHPELGRPVELYSRAVYCRADGHALAHVERAFHLQAEGTTSWLTDKGRGWSEPGQWPVGAYRVDLLLEERKAATGWFEIYE